MDLGYMINIYNNRIFFLLFLFLVIISFTGCTMTDSKIKDLQCLIDGAASGDTIFLQPGVYRGGILIDRSIHLVGIKNKTIIKHFHGKSETNYVISVSSNNCSIKNLTIVSESNDSRIKGINIVSSNNQIGNNNIKKMYCGVYVGKDAHRNTIEKNNLSDNRNGIIIFNTSYNLIFRNYISYSSESGISVVSFSNYNQFQDNVFLYNMYGIHISDGINNTVKANNFSSNVRGIYLCCGARNNEIIENFFIKNSETNARSVTKNQWYENSRGNYYDDYAGYDANTDGIGDSPYNISGGIDKDLYPLLYNPLE